MEKNNKILIGIGLTSAFAIVAYIFYKSQSNKNLAKSTTSIVNTPQPSPILTSCPQGSHIQGNSCVPDVINVFDPTKIRDYAPPILDYAYKPMDRGILPPRVDYTYEQVVKNHTDVMPYNYGIGMQYGQQFQNYSV
jgi:hypothetical protein